LRLILLPWLALLLVLAALLGALWLWSGTNTSLATALHHVSLVLPADQTLESGDVNGSLRGGGHIGWLRWQQGGLTVEARDVQVDWQPAALWQQEFKVSRLALGELRIEDQRPASPDAQPVPPTQLSLPFRARVDFSAEQLEWVSKGGSQHFGKLVFNYIFDSSLHRLDKGYIHILSNKYEFSGDLQAQGPMALNLKTSGVVDTQVPGRAQPLRVLAQAELTGTLAGTQARVALQATLTPQWSGTPDGPPATPALAMQARLTAQLAPWQSQPVMAAHGQWQALNLATLWPKAPQTLLSGEASVRPAGPGWQASVKLRNRLSGPLDQQRLPVQALLAELEFSQGQWQLQSLQADIAGGSVVAKGQWEPAPGAGGAQRWKSEAKVSALNAAGLFSPLASVQISGTLSARQSAKGIGFDIQLQSTRAKLPDPRAPPTGDRRLSLQLQSVVAQGLWSAPLLTLDALRLEAPDAHVQGQLRYHTTDQATQGQLDLSLPGLHAALNGQLASTTGKGTLSVQVQDAAQATRWLARWPTVARALDARGVTGNATLNASWQGGWQNHAQGLKFDASLRAPQLEGLPGNTRSRQLQLDVSGTPGNFSLKGQGLLASGGNQLDWRTQASAGRSPNGTWQASLSQIELALRSPASASPWLLRLVDEPYQSGPRPLSLRWVPGDLANTLSVSAGAARLTGPGANNARLSWQTLNWMQPVNPGQPGSAPTTARWQSQGRVEGLPLAWLDAFTTQPMAELGLSSDLLLSGNWDAYQTDTLHVRMLLERSAGDLRLQTDTSHQGMLPAGMNEARLQVNLDGSQVSGSLRWDSARAGRALMAFSTQLQPRGWTVAANAPIGGSLQLQLPPVDAWSALAPPGWRLRGTMDADIQLAGTLNLPEWSGTLRARDLAVRSVVDGIDFSHGSLLAQLHDQQLDIQEFILQGAGSTGAPERLPDNQIKVSGSVFWTSAKAGAAPGSRLRMNLQAQAKKLRLSTRPDRRVVMSGQLTADLKDGQLILRGALAADLALVTLPDDSAPQLGDDVVVRRPASPASAVKPAKPLAPGKANQTSPDLLVELDLGPDFQLRGKGLTTRLAGKLTLAAKDIRQPALTGTVRTVDGSYQAYGQRLTIERGVLRFAGPLDNPALNILAIRPSLTQRVGVQIIGTALSPVVQLYADPDLPDAEKLAWLVLGRSPSSGGAEAALMQQAALALLGGNGKRLTDSLTQALGLDELSFGGSTSSTEGTASTTSVTLGKRLSNDFYVAYESSLNGAMGVIYIFYDLSRHLTLRAQTGEQSAIDLVYTLRYD